MTQYARAGDVLQLHRRSVNVEPTREYEEIGVRSFGKGIFHKEPVTGAELGSKRVFRIEPGDLVLSNVFAWEGAVAMASTREAGKIGSHRFMTFTSKDERIDTAWAAWFFVSDLGLELIGKASPGSAGRNRTLAIERFENLQIPLPPIDEQCKIATRLSDLAMSSSYLDTMVRHSSKIGGAAGAAMTRRAPDVLSGWSRYRLDELLTTSSSESRVDADALYRMAGVYSFGRGLFARADLEGSHTSYSTLNQLHSGDLVMSRLKAWEGALAVVPPEFDGYFLSPEFPTFDINREKAFPPFLGALLTSEMFWSRLKEESKGIGARKERVQAERLLQQKVELPSLDEQQRRVRIIEAATSVTRSAPDRLACIAALVPAALNQAFCGLS